MKQTEDNSIRTSDTGDVLLADVVHQENLNTETSTQPSHRDITHHRGHVFFNKYIKLLMLLSVTVFITLIGLIVLVVSQKTNQNKEVSKSPCYSVAEENTRHLRNVLLVSRLTSHEKGNNAESSKNDTNGDGNRIHQEAFLDTRYVQHLKQHESLPWLVNNSTNTSNVRYNSHNKSFTIRKKSLYYVYLSFTFNYKNTTEISSTLYRKHRHHDGELLSFSKTVVTAGDGDVLSFYDMEMSGLFHLYKGDELYMTTSNAGCILHLYFLSWFWTYFLMLMIVLLKIALMLWLFKSFGPEHH